ncbi:hypothetical protein ACFP1Z_06650 [Streptomyces gamaensis]|uniref:Integral membrane protein n=1 Tax=Streptomyces gamaensis TaxID=1763542 RepID=A0ABW0YWF6_9ACTN
MSRRHTTVRIPQQPRSWRRQPTPVVVVVPEQLTWRQRAAYAIGHAAWRRRRAFLPTAATLACFTATAVAHLLAPWLWIPLALVTAAALVQLAWAPVREPGIRTRRYGLVAMTLTAGTCATASVAFGPTAAPLPLLWLLLALAAHITRHRLHPAARPAEQAPEENS